MEFPRAPIVTLDFSPDEPSIQAADSGPGASDREEQTNSFAEYSEQRMRRRLRFFFMNPIEKYQAKGRLPWKLGLQIIKIVLVTAQLVFFGYDSSAYQLHHRDTTIALDRLFLRGWTSVREVASYPPSVGPFAVYTKADFYSSVNAVVRRYANVTQTSIASLGYDTPDGRLGRLDFCKTEYRNETRKPHSTESAWVAGDSAGRPTGTVRETTCLTVGRLFPKDDDRWKNFSIQAYIREKSPAFKISFERLIGAEIRFALKTVYLKDHSLPDCYRYHVNIRYNNEAHDGQLLVSLKTTNTKLTCKNNIRFAESSALEMAIRQILNGLVIVVCSASFVLCIRSLLRGQLLQSQTEAFFLRRGRPPLSMADKLDFVDMWYVTILTNDVLIIIGSFIKIQLEQRLIDGERYDFCSSLLGSGNLLVWVGVLRYLGFFRKYNILILTMKRAMPNLLRFLLCTLLLYMGFCFCGWLVLGPHNIKFRSLSSSSENLFALMNGDDMFATFAIMGESNGLIWWFARVYLYAFLILFVYCVISLFLSVIMDSYETVRESYENDDRPSDLWQFIGEGVRTNRGKERTGGGRASSESRDGSRRESTLETAGAPGRRSERPQSGERQRQGQPAQQRTRPATELEEIPGLDEGSIRHRSGLSALLAGLQRKRSGRGYAPIE